MVRILVLNHAWKFPSQAPAGPEVWIGSRAGGGVQSPEAPRNVKMLAKGRHPAPGLGAGKGRGLRSRQRPAHAVVETTKSGTNGECSGTGGQALHVSGPGLL